MKKFIYNYNINKIGEVNEKKFNYYNIFNNINFNKFL